MTPFDIIFGLILLVSALVGFARGASRELTYGDVAPVIEACRAAGVGTVRLATEKVP